MSEAKAMTGAADWRSDAEKDKSLLRTAALSLFKTWIPEHPEASAERMASTLDLSMKAAAINCTRQGCQPPTKAEVLGF